MKRSEALRAARQLYGENVYALGGKGICALVLLAISSENGIMEQRVLLNAVLLGADFNWSRALQRVNERANMPAKKKEAA